MQKELTRKSKFLSLVLRHKPEAAGLELDENGWVDIPLLLQGARKSGLTISREELQKIVDTNEKRRFSICQETNRIRANQGHSLEVDLQLEQATPPELLYHGTTIRFRDTILAEGLKKMNRHHVHLSADLETAKKVGMRHGKLLIFEVDTEAMRAEGHPFFRSQNGVWLTDSVPSKFLRET